MYSTYASFAAQIRCCFSANSPYNCSETNQSFCEDSPPQQYRVLPSDPFSLHYFFTSPPLANFVYVEDSFSIGGGKLCMLKHMYMALLPMLLIEWEKHPVGEVLFRQ